MPGDYFSYFPTVPYETFDGSGRYKVVTDIFKRVRASVQARSDQTISYLTVNRYLIWSWSKVIAIKIRNENWFFYKHIPQ